MKKIAIVMVCWAIAGCANKPAEPTPAGSNPQYIVRNGLSLSNRSIHYYAEELAKQLFSTSTSIYLSQSVAVGTFLPMTDLGGKKRPRANVLGQQLQESFVTIATQAGMSVVEFKTTRAIHVQKNQDVMLSRKVSDINSKVSADYYLTGTHSTQDQGVVINVRLIDVETSNVVAAATDTIPNYVVWQLGGHYPQDMTMVDNRLYHFAEEE